MASGLASNELGIAVEDAVATLCSNSFFPDFVARSPKYRKTAGQEKEAADVLTVFGNTLIALQVKTRILPEGIDADLPEVELARFTRMLGRALDQFRALMEAWRDPAFGPLLNERGLPLNFKRGEPKRLFLIVVYAVLKPDGKRPEFDLRCTKTCHSETPIPIHIFSLSEFTALLRMLDTLPDFLLYLETRAALHELNIIPTLANPLDVWTLATFERARMVAALENKTLLDIDGLMHRHQQSVAQLEEAEKPSYLIDWLIHELHAGSGKTLALDPQVAGYPGLTEAPGSMEAYQRCIPYFAQLNREERGKLARELFIRIERSRDGSPSFGGLKFKDHEEGYLVLAAPGPRKGRHPLMISLGQVLAHRMKLHRVVCIGTGPGEPRDDGCDVLAVEVDLSRPSGELEGFAAEWFGAPRTE